MINDIGSPASTLRVVCRDVETDSVLVVLGTAGKGVAGIVAALNAACRSTQKPFIVAWTRGSGRPRQESLAHRVQRSPDPWRAMRALSHVVEHRLRRVTEPAVG